MSDRRFTLGLDPADHGRDHTRVLFRLPPPVEPAERCSMCERGSVVPLPAMRGQKPDLCGDCAVWFLAEFGKLVALRTRLLRLNLELEALERRGLWPEAL